MRIRHPFVVGLLATFLPLAAWTASPPDGTAVQIDPAGAEQTAMRELSGPQPPVPLLWRMSDEDNTVYLLGAFHLLKTGDYPLPADVDAAFEDAERLVFEVAPEQLDDPASAGKFLLAAGYADGRKMADVLSPEVHAKLTAMVRASDLALLPFERFEPWFVNLTLLMSMAQPMGFSGEQGLDRHLMLRAKAAGKPATGLETLDHQLAVLDSTPMDEQVRGLSELVEDPAETARKLDELHAAWRAGDIEALTRLAIDDMKAQAPESYRRVNVERNLAWLPQLRALLDQPGEDDVLVVVGAMHLFGEDGVIEGLRAAGYDVQRVCSACELPPPG